MNYKKINIICKDSDAEAISDRFFELGALSVTFEDAADEPIFQEKLNETLLWKSTKVSALFSEDTESDSILSSLKENYGDFDFNCEILPDEDWVRKTQAGFPPQFFEDVLCIEPAWLKDQDFKGKTVKIDPGLAFGTGTHPTTAMCLRWLASHDIQNKIVVDFGCGSGILALAALALGAQKVYAIDHDPQALTATENNASLNTIANKKNLIILSSENIPYIQVDLVIANILANPLVELSEKISDFVQPKGSLILSGILEAEIERVFSAYQNQFEKVESVIQENWALIECFKYTTAQI